MRRSRLGPGRCWSARHRYLVPDGRDTGQTAEWEFQRDLWGVFFPHSQRVLVPCHEGRGLFESQGVFMTIEAAFTRFPSLTTNRLRLRQIQPEDAEAIFATFSDEETMQFTGHGPYRLLDETRRFLEQIQKRYAFRGRFGDEHFFGLLQDEWLRSV